MITTSTFGMRCPWRRLPKALTAVATAVATVVATTAATTMVVATTALVDECLQAMEAMKQRLEVLERVVEDDYKFLNCNVRKLFGIVGNMRGKWCNTCLKYH
jgi:hypothetical protein